MTTATLNSKSEENRLRTRIDALFLGLGQGFNAYLERKSRLHEIEALNAKTDAELQAMGLRRDDIPRHVFRDLLYL
jgi:hypothetical protein